MRYRLKKMREAGVLRPARTYTHERKLGLGENIILADTTPGSRPILEEIFKDIDCIYFWASTYGKYNGFIINSLYSLTTPSVSRRLMEAFQKEGLVSDYYMFDATDYEHKFGDFTKFDPKLGWQYDWKDWHKKIKKNLKSKSTKINTTCDENPSLIEFDNSDFGILRSLFDDAMVQQKKLAKKFSLSETQVTKRIKRLEQESVIKGYGSRFKIVSSYIDFNLFIDIEEPAARIMNNFYTHPFLGSILMESRTRWDIRMALPANDLGGFLEGLDLMRPYLKTCVLQIIYSFHRDESVHPYCLFNEETHNWETPVADYLEVFSSIMAKYSKR